MKRWCFMASLASKLVVLGLLLLFYLPSLHFLLKGAKKFTASRSTWSSDELKHLHGLLTGRDPDSEQECQSRTQQHLFRRRVSEFLPSKYLLRKLREYEQLHGRCSQQIENLAQLLQGENVTSPSTTTSCRFLIWRNYSGLGNKIVSIVSSFLYALLTGRVLLIDRGADMHKLFCEPFPTGSWFLPQDFPLKNLGDCKITFDHANFCVANRTSTLGRYGCVDLADKYDKFELFFCDKQQEKLASLVTWLFVTSNLYFVPSLFYVGSFRGELEKMFPEQEAVFHHLARYLLHPSNPVWGRTVRFYTSYLKHADRLVGIQIRAMPHLGFWNTDPEAHVKRTVGCCVETGLLPPVLNVTVGVGTPRLTAVVVTSLDVYYFDMIRELYIRSEAEDGSTVAVFSPSHEGKQQTESLEHDEKALMEMLLLSLSDELVTSPGSTFGYVAQGLGGIRPLLLAGESSNGTSCSRLNSMEPCFHGEVVYECDCATRVEAKMVQENVQSCQDVTWGVQLKSK